MKRDRRASDAAPGHGPPDPRPSARGPETSIIPPMAATPDIRVTTDPLSADAVLNDLHGSETGAVVLFLGTVRDSNEGRAVTRLVYEAYEPMAVSELEKLRAGLMSEFGLTACRIHHRIGELALGDAALAAATCAPHRKAALQAMDALVDRLKRMAPIWKREHFAGGAVWVGPQR